MNRLPRHPVSIPVKAPFYLLLTGFIMLLQSCSSSRTQGQEFAAPAGPSSSKTVKSSDIFIGSESAVSVSYSENSRYFVAAGGTLSGFQKGASNTTIYAEKGAALPEAPSSNGLKIITVDNALKTYETRHEELPSRGAQVGNSNRSYRYGYGFGYGHGFGYGSRFGFRGRSSRGFSRGFSGGSRGGFRGGSRGRSRR